MKRVFLSLALLLSLQTLSAKNYINYALSKPVTTSLGSGNASKITDGAAPTYQWRCSKKGKEQWVEIDLTAQFDIYAAHIYFDLGNLMPLDNWVLQYHSDGKWIDIESTATKGNFAGRVEQRFDGGISMDKLRLVTTNTDAFGIDEIQLWGDNVPAMPYAIESKVAEEYAADKHWVCVNQVAYNVGAPKRFTVPTAKSNLPFQIVERESGKVCFKGRLKDGLGDFTKFNPSAKGVEYVIRVSGGNLPDGESYPFEIGERAIQRMSYVPALNFMNDARSLAGSHPSAYGGTPWRDGTYYTYELPSMVLLYLSDPDYFKSVPVTLSWRADSAKIVSPDFKKTKDPKDEDALPALRRYYTELPAPKSEQVPDLIQDIRFTVGWYLCDPVTHDPSGDSSGNKMHAETVAQLAYFLYGYPAMEQYISDDFYQMALDSTERWWGSVGLFDVIDIVGTGKGRNCPGFSIMPNLMMYEVAKRESSPLSKKYMDAAIAQCEWVIDNVDWNNPIYTKGQRISEHKLATGLVHFYLNYKEFAPAGLKDKIEALGERYVAMSDNMWDFRRFDLEENWTVPGFNECGNVAAFPACALGVAMCVEDNALRSRLEELGYSHFDNLFGRNPLNAHAANHPNLSFVGVDYGFPYKYHDNVCARLELTRGSISSLPGTEMYPFNPKGKNRWPEGWTAYNAGWNVALAFLNFYESQNNDIKVLSDPLYTDKSLAKKIGDDIDYSGYNLLFSDEFDGDKLDLDKWVYRTDVKHKSVQLRENVEIEKGYLKLNLHRLSTPLSGKMATGAGIVTRERFRYGLYEVRAKLGTGKVDSTIDQGWHHSFWAMATVIEGDSVSTTYPTMRRTEIDCYENSNNLNEYTQHVIIWKANGSEFGRRPTPPADRTKIEGFEASEWHTYAFEWGPDRIIFYVDGKVTQIGEYSSTQFEHDYINVWLSAMSAQWCSSNQKDSQALYDYFRFYESK